MNVLKVVENIGYGVVSVGVEQVAMACLDMACPTRRAKGIEKVLKVAGKNVIGFAIVKKTTDALKEEVEELTQEILDNMVSEKK